MMLTCTVALVLPAVFYKYLAYNADYDSSVEIIAYNTLKISRGVAIISLLGYMVYIAYQTMTHDGLFHEIYEADEHMDVDRHQELAKPKLTMTEVIIALLVSLACVSLVAIFLVLEIPSIVEDHGISDAFVGLILVPLVEKIAGMYKASSDTVIWLTHIKNIYLQSMRHTTTRSTWLSRISWVLLSRPHCSTRRLSVS